MHDLQCILNLLAVISINTMLLLPRHILACARKFDMTNGRFHARGNIIKIVLLYFDEALVSEWPSHLNRRSSRMLLLYITLSSYTFPGKPGFTKKQADLFFPPDFADDFPVSMQVTSWENYPCILSGKKYDVISQIILWIILADISQVRFDICHHKAWSSVRLWSWDSYSSLQKSD